MGEPCRLTVHDGWPCGAYRPGPDDKCQACRHMPDCHGLWRPDRPCITMPPANRFACIYCGHTAIQHHGHQTAKRGQPCRGSCTCQGFLSRKMLDRDRIRGAGPT